MLRIRHLFVFVLLAVSAASHAVLFPVGIFAAPAPLQETFDPPFVAGSYLSFPAFPGAGGTMFAFGGPGDLLVGPPLPFLSAPNSCMGVNANALITVRRPMSFFGGWFLGLGASAVTFRFYDVAGVLTGTGVRQLSTTWQWIGYVSVPRYIGVEIVGNGVLPGGVDMDNLRMLP
jgi:hypothetical protein